ncbi:MAG TPA: rhodanese-like domain-containing protein [Gammaproteobacteria bacterium]|nr:rhodanese-like domain-containing protein [Gammaproteobacteria bacterium]
MKTGFVLLLASMFWGLSQGHYALAGTEEMMKLNQVKAQIRTRFPAVKQLSTDEYKQITAQSMAVKPVLLDVREFDEFKVSHLKGAKLSTDIGDALRILRVSPKTQKIVTYCSVGYRSSALAKELAERGFSNVFNLEGSIFEWANKGYPVFRGNERVNKVHPYNSKWGKLLEKKYHP